MTGLTKSKEAMRRWEWFGNWLAELRKIAAIVASVLVLVVGLRYALFWQLIQLLRR